MWKFIKKPKFYISAIVILIIIGFIVRYSLNKNKGGHETAVVLRETIKQEVSVTGTVKPAEEINLAFETGGRVSRVGADVGDHVTAGQTLVELDRTELQASLSQVLAGAESARALLLQYRAAVDAQKAKLSELVRGTRPEEIAVKETELAKVQQDLANDYNDLLPVLRDAYNKADDAVRKQTDELFTNDDSPVPTLSFNTTNSQAQIDAQSQRYDAGVVLNKWLLGLEQLTQASTQAGLDRELVETKTRLSKMLNFINTVSSALDGAVNLSQTNITTYRTNLNTGRTNLTTAQTSVTTQENTISAQKLTVNKIEDELKLKLAGSTPEAIANQEAAVRQAEAYVASQQALVKQAEANIEAIQAKIAKTYLRSPIAGVVSKQEIKKGEIVAANNSLISVISDNQLEIKVDVPEVDIAKVQLGNTAEVTLDAYGNDLSFVAKVVAIEPAETVIQGVIYYKVTMTFDKVDERLKPGMTANIDILTAQKDNVLVVPQRAVLTEGGRTWVRVVDQKDPKNYIKQEIKLGTSGIGGMVEVVSGLSEGEIIITFLKE